MCYYSAHTAKIVNAQTGDVLQFKAQMHGTNWRILAGTKLVACLKPGTEVEILKIPFIARWNCKRIEPGVKATFQCLDSGDRLNRDVFVLADGQPVSLQQLPHRLTMRVTAVPVPRRPRQEFPDLKVDVEELEEDLVAASVG